MLFRSINVLYIPVYGYMASAWAHIACYSVMVIMSYFIGRKHYRVDYDVSGFFIYTGLAIAIVIFALYTGWGSTPLRLGVNTLILIGFIAFAQRRDGTLSLFLKRS